MSSYPVKIAAQEIDEAEAFWESIGFTVKRVHENQLIVEPSAILLVTEVWVGGSFCSQTNDGAINRNGPTELVYEVGNIEEIETRLSDKQIEFTKSRLDGIELSDPDGNKVSFTTS